MSDDDLLRARFRAVSAVAGRRPLPRPEQRADEPSPRRPGPALLVAACTAALLAGIFAWGPATLFHARPAVQAGDPTATNGVPRPTTGATPTGAATGTGPSPASTSPSAVAPATTPGTAATSPASPFAHPGDLAFGAAASQSSTAAGADASRAVDGATSAANQNTIARTAAQAQPWWQVDLGYVTDLGGISLWTATPGGGPRSALHVLVSDVAFSGPSLAAAQSTPGVLDVTPVPGTNGVTNASADRTGRYVRVQLDGTGSLALAEVKVWPTIMTNIARSGRAEQSSTWDWPPSPASLAVDGNTDGDWQHGSVAHTGQEAEPWWQVDLGSRRSIGTVALWNRTDCCAERLTDAHLLVSDVPFSGTSLAAAQSTHGVLDIVVPGAAGLPSTVAVNRLGRYVRVQLATTQYLALAEVQIWSPLRPDLAVGAPVTTSSSLESWGWFSSTLTDGVLGPLGWSSNNDLSADHTEWARVDLGSRTRVGAVTLYPRTDDPGYGVPSDVDVRISTDGRTWTRVASTRGDTAMTSQPRTLYFAPATARYVEVRGSGLRPNPKDAGGPYRFQLAEIGVYGPPAGA